MSSSSHHTINVTHNHNGREQHWFRVDTDHQSKNEVKIIADSLRTISGAVSVSVVYWDCIGQPTSI